MTTRCEQYLKKHGLSAATLEDPAWPTKHADGGRSYVHTAVALNSLQNELATWWRNDAIPLGANAIRREHPVRGW